MNNMNFFGWIRDGVRQSVLLGVSDAVEQLGTPAQAEEIHPSVAGLLQMDHAAPSSPKLPGNPSSAAKNRKRLGRSLKDIGSGPT